MKNVIFIYNPSSGEIDIGLQLDHIITLYQKAGYLITPLRISRELGFKPIPDLVRGLPVLDHILIAGGDGTVNRFVNFLLNNGIDIPIAILPAGTANDFASMLGMPHSINSSIKAILTGKIKKVDVGKVDDKYFVNILSCGLFTDISQKTPTVLKNTFGKVAYYFGSIGELPNFRKMQIEVKSDELSYSGQCLLFMIFNGRTAGTLQFAQLSSATDGVLDVLIIKGENIANTIHTLFHLLFQRKGNYPDDIVYFQTNKLTVTAKDNTLTTDIDGEPGGSFPLNIECLHEAISVIVPNTSKIK